MRHEREHISLPPALVGGIGRAQEPRSRSFRRTGPEEALPVTRPVFLYLRLSRAHGDGRDAIERQRVDLVRMLAAEWLDGDGGVRRPGLGQRLRPQRAAGVAGVERRDQFGPGAGGGVLEIASHVSRGSTVSGVGGDLPGPGVHLLSFQDSTEELNSVSAAAKLSTGVKALLAEAETDTMSERQRAAKRHAAQAGSLTVGTARSDGNPAHGAPTAPDAPGDGWSHTRSSTRLCATRWDWCWPARGCGRSRSTGRSTTGLPALRADWWASRRSVPR